MIQKFKIIILLALFFVSGTAQGKSRSKCYYKFFLQPYKGSEILINNVKVSPKILYKDKTMGMIRINVTKYQQFNLLPIEIKNKKFKTLKRKINLAKDNKNRCMQKAIKLFQLQKKNSALDLIGYYKTGRWPKGITFIGKRKVVVPLLKGNGVDVIDILSGESTRIKVPYKKYGKYRGFAEALFIASKKEFWVSQMTRRAIHVFDSEKLRYKRTIDLKGVWPKVLVLDQSRKRVYCSNWVSKNISIIDTSTYKELYRINTLGVPRGLVLSKDRRFLFVAQFTIGLKYDYKGRILKIDLDKKKIIKKFGNRGTKRHLALDNKKRLFVSDINHFRIEVYNSESGEKIKFVKVYYKPNTIELSGDEKYLFISCRGPNNPENYKKKGPALGRIYIMNTETLEIENIIEGGNQPTGLALSGDGNFLVTSDFLDNRIRVYEIQHK